MASVGALSARPHLGGCSLRRSGAKRAGKVSTVARAEHKPGINMADGPADDLNKWSRKITQPKSQGASQVRQATHQIRRTDRESVLSPDRASPRTRHEGSPLRSRERESLDNRRRTGGNLPRFRSIFPSFLCKHAADRLSLRPRPSR